MAQLIAGVEQVLQVLNHRQASANVSVIEELTARAAGRMAQLVIVIQRRGIGLFVRRHHMETFAQEVGVLIGDRLAGGTVDDHRIEQVVLFHQADQTAKIKRLFRLSQRFTPVLQIQAMNAGQQRLRIGYTADAQIDMFVLQPSLLALDLLQQRAADAADADDKHFNHLVGVEQHLMGHAHAGGGVVIADHHRNRALGRALGNRHDIDIGAGQRRKKFRRDTAQGTHPVAHHGDDGQTLHNGQRLQQPLFQLETKLIFHRPFGTRAIALRHAETDAVLRRGLGDQYHRDASAGHGGEDACRHADHAFHPRTGDVEHRHIVEVRDAFHRQVVFIATGADERSRRLRVAGIFDQAWDLKLSDRGNGARMQHFRAKVGELHRLLIRH